MTNATATAALSTHKGAFKVQREELLLLPMPQTTLSFRPVRHSELIDTIETSLHSKGMQIERGEYAIQSDGQKLFATLVLKSVRDDYAFALGIRAANDKSMAINLVVGSKVFVCDNMVLSGDDTVLYEKHTARLTLRQAVEAAVAKSIGRFSTFETNLNRLKSLVISDNEAKAKMTDAVVGNILQARLLGGVYQAYFEPKHKEFEPRTMWSLHNAFTEIYRDELRPNILLDSTQELGKFFEI